MRTRRPCLCPSSVNQSFLKIAVTVELHSRSKRGTSDVLHSQPSPTTRRRLGVCVCCSKRVVSCCTCPEPIFRGRQKINTMKLFVFSTLLAAAAAFTSQPVTGPAKLADSPARSRTVTIVHDGKANGTFWADTTHAYACILLPVVVHHEFPANRAVKTQPFHTNS